MEEDYRAIILLVRGLFTIFPYVPDFPAVMAITNKNKTYGERIRPFSAKTVKLP